MWSRRWCPSAGVFALALTWVACGPAWAQTTPGIPDDPEFWEVVSQTRWIKIDRGPDLTDPKVHVAWNMRQVLLRNMTQLEFYRELSKMDLGGAEPRQFLVEVKTDLLAHLGTAPVEHILGEVYYKDSSAPTGEGTRQTTARGSKVEDILLEWRSGLAEEVKVRVARNMAEQKFSAFYADVGSQPEGPGAKSFSGDVDVNAVCADIAVSQRMVELAEAEIRGITGLTGAEIDVVFTALGLAGPEVYPSEPGRIKATEMILEGKAGNIRRVVFGQGVGSEELTGRQALTEVALEGILRDAQMPLPDSFKLPDAGPAVVLEMARHLERDVLRTGGFEDFEAMFKIAKFVTRAEDELVKAGHPLDPELVDFSRKLLDAKGADDIAAANRIIQDYFAESLPKEVELGRSPSGKTAVTIEANKKFLNDFGESCRDVILDGGKQYLRARIGELEGRVRALGAGGDSPQAVADELLRLRNDMEVESWVLHHETEGLRTPDAELDGLTRQVSDLGKDLLGEHWRDILPEHMKRQRQFVADQLEHGGELNEDFALASVVHQPEGLGARALGHVMEVNNLLDSLDDMIAGDFRGDRDWALVLYERRKVGWAEHARRFLDVEALPGSVSDYLQRAEAVSIRIEDKINPLFFDNFLARRVQQANRAFSESIQSSSAAQAGMKALTVVNLASELPAYWDAYDQKGWSGFAVEFMRRRVPGTTVLEHIMMGNLGLATWDLFKTIVPPLSMGEMVYGVGGQLAQWSWDLYWTAEMDYFIDELYAEAEFVSRGARRVGDGVEVADWQVESVTYRGEKVVVRDYLRQKGAELREMRAALEPETSHRTAFPYEHAINDPLMGWLANDDALRETLARSDNQLLVLEAKMKDGLAGSELKTLFHRTWTVRWEELKVSFFRRVLERLADRRQAEQVGVERIAKVAQELARITSALSVREAVDAALYDELGNEVIRYLKWVGDQLVDEKREFLSQPGSEDEYEEGLRVLLHYLEVYRAILEARAPTEGLFVSDGRAKEDHELRILSTPLLLAGRASEDERGYRRWAELPGQEREKVAAELEAIKLEWAGGSLEAAADSFDQKTLRGVLYHDVWKALWRHVQVSSQTFEGTAGLADVRTLSELWRGVTRSDAPSGGGLLPTGAIMTAVSDQPLPEPAGEATSAGGASSTSPGDLALTRFRSHDSERDRLVKEFLLHYLTAAGELDKLLARAQSLSQEVAELCAGARGEIEGVLVEADSLEVFAAELESTSERVRERLTQIPERAIEVADGHRLTEDAATRLGELAHQMEELSLQICRKLEQLRATVELSRQRELLAEMESLMARQRQGIGDGRDMLDQVEEHGRLTASAFSRLKAALEEWENLQKADAEMGDGAEAQSRLNRVDSMLHDAGTRLEELGTIQSEALAVLERVSQGIDDLEEADQTEILGIVEAKVDTVIAVVEATGDCSGEIESELEAARARLAEAIRRLDAARAELSSLDRLAGEQEMLVPTAERQAEAAEYLVELAGAYLERIQIAAEDAALCIALAEDAIPDPTQLEVPDVTGWPASEASNRLRGMGLTPSVVGGEPAPSPQQAFKVASQSPAGGAPAPENGVVTLSIFGEASTVTVPLVLGLAAAEARAAVEAAGLTAALVAGGLPSRPDDAFRIESQQPTAGTPVERGEAVTMRVFGEFDPDTVLAGVDCSSWPGTAAVWNAATESAECRCRAPAAWNDRLGRCVEAAPPPSASVPPTAPPAAPTQPPAGTAPPGSHIAQQLNDRCRDWDAQILAACGNRDIQRAQQLIAAAQQAGCRPSQSAIACVGTRPPQQQGPQQPGQGWTQLMGTLTDLIQIQQGQSQGPTDLSANDLSQIFGNTPPPAPPIRDPAVHPTGLRPPPVAGGGAGSTGGGGGSGGGGRSREECERQYCPMCSNDVLLLQQSVDPQCTKCLKLNSAKIAACISGQDSGPAIQTTETYRVVCRMEWDEQRQRSICRGHSVLEPNRQVSPGYVVVFQSRSWDACMDYARSQNPG